MSCPLSSVSNEFDIKGMDTMIERFKENPIITPADIRPSRPDMQVVGAFNAGATRQGDDIVLLIRVAEAVRSNNQKTLKVPVLDCKDSVRIVDIGETERGFYDLSDSRVVRDIDTGVVEYLTTLSHFRLARSKDGLNFEIDDTPTIFPSGPHERWGIEDPRITKIGETYHIVYSSVSTNGVSVSLITTKDFKDFKRHGVIFPPENKDVCLFPETIGGYYHAYHRPVPSDIGTLDIWNATSRNLTHWGAHRHVLSTRDNPFARERLGGGAPPIKTKKGWLNIYHAATKEKKYCLGAFLTDLDDPSTIIAKTHTPLLKPEMDYETQGFFNNVVFTCGTVMEDEETLLIYYGASDETMAMARVSLQDLFKEMT